MKFKSLGTFLLLVFLSCSANYQFGDSIDSDLPEDIHVPNYDSSNHDSNHDDLSFKLNLPETDVEYPDFEDISLSNDTSLVSPNSTSSLQPSTTTTTMNPEEAEIFEKISHQDVKEDPKMTNVTPKLPEVVTPKIPGETSSSISNGQELGFHDPNFCHKPNSVELFIETYLRMDFFTFVCLSWIILILCLFIALVALCRKR